MIYPSVAGTGIILLVAMNPKTWNRGRICGRMGSALALWRTVATTMDRSTHIHLQLAWTRKERYQRDGVTELTTAMGFLYTIAAGHLRTLPVAMQLYL